LDFFTPEFQSHNGAPDPNWFYDMTAKQQPRKYLQLDFVWSLALAQPRGH
jgi:hypothetical protein